MAIWLLVAMAIAVGAGLPIYRALSQGSTSAFDVTAQSDAEIADQPEPTDATQATASPTDLIQIPTRLTYHADGTVSVWFHALTGSVYRIDYADTKTAALTDMVWQVATDDLAAGSNGWMEWVDAGDEDRPAPWDVNERYYRVVLKTPPSDVTISGAETTTQEPATQPAEGTTEVPTGQEVPVEGESGSTESPATIPAEILELLQRKGALDEWNESRAARYLAELQECALLGDLVAGGEATEEGLRDALAKSKLRISILMTFGQSLFQAGDRHHAQLFFEAIVQYHAKRATSKQIARSHLWVARIHRDEGLQWRYVTREPERARPEFEAAAMNFLMAKDVSQDWVRETAWLEAAGCYRELGNQEKRRECLEGLLADPIPGTNGRPRNAGSVDDQLSLSQRDIANYLLATSYYEEKRFVEAAQKYQRIRDRINEQVRTSSEQYSGQTKHLELAGTGLNWCGERQAERSATSDPQVASTETQGQVAP